MGQDGIPAPLFIMDNTNEKPGVRRVPHPDMQQPQAAVPIVASTSPVEEFHEIPATPELIAPVPTPPVPTPPPAPMPEPPAKIAPIAPADVFFKKVMVNMPFIVAGQRVGFEVLDKNTGVIRLHTHRDTAVVVALTAAANARKGGIVLIDEAQYESLKKKLPLTTSAQRSKPQRLQVWRGPQPIKRPQESKANWLANRSRAGSGAVAPAAEAAKPNKISSSTADKPSVGVASPVSGKPGGGSTGGPSSGNSPNVVRRTPIARPPRTATAPRR